MDDSLTLVSLITAPDMEAGTVARTLAWVIPTRLAAEFAAGMTDRFGEPAHEALASNEAMAEMCDRDEATVFIDRTEVTGA